MRHLHVASFAAAVTLASSLLVNPAHAGVRAFVSSTGNDANTASSCAPTTPCRGFTAAMSVVDPGGEIVALDAAGYGAVTVTKSVSIIANPGFYAGVAASTGTAITIATPGVKVVLRGLSINNLGAATTGINMTSGAKLIIENCVISNFTSRGINAAATAEVVIADSTIRNNTDGLVLSNGATVSVVRSVFAANPGSWGGIWVDAQPTGTTTDLAVSDSVFADNHVGVFLCALAGAAGRASVAGSALTNNNYGVATNNCGGTQTVVVANHVISGNIAVGLNNSGATFQSFSNNTGGFNGANTAGTITPVSGF